MREEVEEAESYTYSSDRGAEPEGEGDKKRKRRPRRRRAKPEAIAARLKTGGEDEVARRRAGSEADRAPTQDRLTFDAAGELPAAF